MLPEKKYTPIYLQPSATTEAIFRPLRMAWMGAMVQATINSLEN